MSEGESVNISLFLHLFFVLLYVGSVITASVIRFSVAFGTDQKAYDVGLLLSIVRPLVPLVVISLLVAMAFGFWCADADGHKLDEAWLAVTYALIGWMLLVGMIAGKHDKQTRIMAENEGKLDRDTLVSDELLKRLKSPYSFLLNASLVASITVVVAMMVWKPGQESTDDHATT